MVRSGEILNALFMCLNVVKTAQADFPVAGIIVDASIMSHSDSIPVMYLSLLTAYGTFMMPDALVKVGVNVIGAL